MVTSNNEITYHIPTCRTFFIQQQSRFDEMGFKHSTVFTSCRAFQFARSLHSTSHKMSFANRTHKVWKDGLSFHIGFGNPRRIVTIIMSGWWLHILDMHSTWSFESLISMNCNFIRYKVVLKLFAIIFSHKMGTPVAR